MCNIQNNVLQSVSHPHFLHMKSQAIKEDAEKDLAEATPALEEGTYVRMLVRTY